jgi:hypothetical protein
LKVALGLSGFMCKAEILRALGDRKDPKAICNNVDVIILGDGKYPAFDWPTDYSTDGWLELAKETYPNTITYKLAGEQSEKRQKYLNIAANENCDFLIVYDSDEYIYHDKNRPRYPNWDIFYDRLERASKAFPEESLFQMWAYLPSLSDWDRAGNVSMENSYQPYVRIIKNPGEIKYSSINHHSLVKRDAEPHDWINSWIIIDGVRFSMDSKLRNPDFLDKRNKWALKQLDDETIRLYHYFEKNPQIQKQLISSINSK